MADEDKSTWVFRINPETRDVELMPPLPLPSIDEWIPGQYTQLPGDYIAPPMPNTGAPMPTIPMPGQTFQQPPQEPVTAQGKNLLRLQTDQDIALKPNELGSTFCTYELRNALDILVYVGHCKLIDLYSMNEARLNTEFEKALPPNSDMKIRIVSTSPNRFDCSNHAFDIRKSESPYMNLNGHSKISSRGSITCVETGETWQSAHECSKAHGISPSALSNHLNQRVGHRTIKGKTYRRGS